MGSRRAKHMTWLVALGLIVACGGGGSDGVGPAPPSLPFGPDDAFGGEVPASAQWVEPEEFGARMEDGSLTIVTLAQIVEQEEAAQAQAAQDRLRAEEIYAGRMEVLERHVSEPDATDPDYEPLPDGNWLVRVQRADAASGREERRVVLQGSRYAYGELVAVHERYHTTENQRGLYEDLYNRLDEAFIDRNDLPDPITVIHFNFEELEALNLKIALAWNTIELSANVQPPGWPVSAWNEEGHGGGDEADYPTHPGMWPQLDFPLKWRATSVKWQGHRGTCVAFGITAAVEAIIARDLDRWVNLSEQMLYNRAKQKWWPSTYGDGLYTGPTLGMMSIQQHRYTWEDTWDYNLSLQRVDGVWLYMNSCLGYTGSPCSDANHQARLLTTTLPGGIPVCGYVDAATEIPADAGFSLDVGYTLWTPASVSLGTAKAALAVGMPVVIAVTVSNSMVEPALTSDGIVTFNPILGGHAGHCMALMGYVANTDLPPGTPPGSGGGYFVCKNSWGTAYGDGGYCYLPDSWVAFWAKGLYVLNDVVVP